MESLILAPRRTDSERSQLATSRSCSRVTRRCSDRRRLGLSREVTEGTSRSRAPAWACGVCCMLVLPHGVLVRPTACREATGPSGVPPAELVSGSNLSGTSNSCGTITKARAFTPCSSADAIWLPRPQSRRHSVLEEARAHHPSPSRGPCQSCCSIALAGGVRRRRCRHFMRPSAALQQDGAAAMPEASALSCARTRLR